ncbi:hypothetical protein [Streptomyces sp. NBC_01497]|uniref:hypothetical protein n=1 Tax=Streptomyces sp. NBC_01497 TaxID=2903885 RepID=UPI002E349D60|nr:hypothetical protein [Streptomyces sp. NBC_01497]
MLTPDMSDTGWSLFAVLAGLALGVAGMTMATTRGRQWALLLLPPLAGFAAAAFQSTVDGDSGREVSYLFTLAALDLVVLRLVYAPWMKRQLALYREGRPVTVVGARQISVFLLLFAAVTAAVAFLVH